MSKAKRVEVGQVVRWSVLAFVCIWGTLVTGVLGLIAVRDVQLQTQLYHMNTQVDNIDTKSKENARHIQAVANALLNHIQKYDSSTGAQ